MVNELRTDGNKLYRILAIADNRYLVIDCAKNNMPVWVSDDFIAGLKYAQEEALKRDYCSYDDLPADKQKTVLNRYRMVSGVLPFLTEDDLRNKAIDYISDMNNITKQTLRSYYIKYLIYQEKEALSPKIYNQGKTLSVDEKNIRYALNKYFYTIKKNTLRYAYVQMLRDRYTDNTGKLYENYPSFTQFRYFYRKNKKMETYYISREGIKEYQKNYRPLLGENVQAYAEASGIMGMVDSTVCDIYLINESGQVIGRPILTACVDAYSGLCMGYSLGWEGGIYSVKGLLQNMITDKKCHCQKFGINIKRSEWDCSGLPLSFVTDKGTEYTSENFENITDLGINIINLPAYRPDLKGSIEKFFDIVQDYFKPYLKGRGVVEKDYMQRGVRDYRKDSSLTLYDFESILIRCIIFYNSARVLSNFPYTEDMLDKQIKPHCSDIWNYSVSQYNPTIKVETEALYKVMLPRTAGKFTRTGLMVNSLRYLNSDYKELYLSGGTVQVAYDPEDVSKVYLSDKMVVFTLIESRYQGKSLEQVQELKYRQNYLVKSEEKVSLQAQLDLAEHIEVVRESSRRGNPSIKNIRDNRKKEVSATKGVHHE